MTASKPKYRIRMSPERAYINRVLRPVNPFSQHDRKDDEHYDDKKARESRLLSDENQKPEY